MNKITIKLIKRSIGDKKEFIGSMKDLAKISKSAWDLATIKSYIKRNKKEIKELKEDLKGE